MLTALNRLMAEEYVDVGAALNGGSNAPSEHGDEDAGLHGPGSGRSSRLGSSEGGGDGQERDGNGAAPTRTIDKRLLALGQAIDPEVCVLLLQALADHLSPGAGHASHLSCAMVHDVEVDVGGAPTVVRTGPSSSLGLLLDKLVAVDGSLAAADGPGTARVRSALRALITQSGPEPLAQTAAGLTKEALEALGRSIGAAISPAVGASGAGKATTAASEKITEDRVYNRSTGLLSKLRAKHSTAPAGHELANLTLLNLMHESLVEQGRWPTSVKLSIDKMAPLEDAMGNSLSAGEVGLKFDEAGSVRAGQRDPEGKDARDTSELLAKFAMACNSMALVCVETACSGTVGAKHYCHEGRSGWCSLTSADLLIKVSRGLKDLPLDVVRSLLSEVWSDCRDAVNDPEVAACDLVSPSAAMRAQAKALAKEVRRLKRPQVALPASPSGDGPGSAGAQAPASVSTGAVSIEELRTLGREAAREAAVLALRTELPPRPDKEKGKRTREESRKRNEERRNAKVTASDGKEYAAKQGGNRANPDWCPNPNCFEKSWCPMRHAWST